MHFNRAGIDRIYEVVEAGKIEAVIVKDLSRLGRHRTQTALFIDYLREHNVRVLSATENIDTFNENDDLIVGFKGLVNDFYARDGSRRVRTGYRQKQKAGLVFTPPFGYRKDRNTTQKSHSGQYLWTYPGVKNVLKEETCTGVLINHYTETNNGNVTRLSPEKRFRHENVLPPIISKELWNAAQKRLKAEARPAHGNKPKHRYAGLLRCAECGNVFVPMIRYWNGNRRVEYICRGYQR